MDPISQMMQAHGATSSQAAAALFGSQPTTEGHESGFAALFGGLMQGFQADNAKGGVAVDGIRALEQLSPAQAEFLAALGVTIPAEQQPASFQGDLGALTTNSVDAAATDASAAEADFAKLLPASLIQVNIAATANATGSPETAQLPLADIASLPEGVKTDLLNTLQGMTTTGTLPALTLTAPNGEAHILPVEELAALINTPEPAQGVVGAPQTVAAQTTAHEVANPVVTAPPPPASAQAGAEQATSDTLSAGLVTPTAEAVNAAPAASANDAAASDAAANDAADMANVATAAQLANAGKQATTASNDAQQKAADQTAQDMADGYVVAANPQQNNAVQSNAGQAQKKTATTIADKVLSATGEDGKAAPSRPDTLTARPLDPVAARPETMPQMNAARDPLLTMTPERLTGLPDGSAADIVSTGLSGMRGDGGFMASMSLLGGNASRGLQGHVAKQLNMSVSKAVKAGEQEFTMRLDPAELGRVQVKLRFMDGGRVHAQVIAERPETLELLQRDARGLERAIDASGGKTQGATIEFSLDQGSGEESAGKAFAEAVQQEKMRDELAARSAGGHAAAHGDDDAGMGDVPLDEILPYVDAETGLDIRV
ncbi:flagellar hook-length control protein FliK [Kordiimonas sp.]|uniref:flagellar hook-length control protein FliK n=1 Tax=Kordiimonas sp. TaxID=1970157 RepID=UPI003A9071C9